MLTTQDARKIVNQAFEDEALVIGGLLAVQPVEDSFVRRLVRSLAVIRRRTLRAFEAAGSRNAQNEAGHPAIAEFLQELREQ